MSGASNLAMNPSFGLVRRSLEMRVFCYSACGEDDEIDVKFLPWWKKRMMKQRKMGGSALPCGSKKVVKLERFLKSRCLFWIFCGFGLISICLSSYHSTSPTQVTNGEETHPSITIFASPRPFSSSDDKGSRNWIRSRQELALRSWLALSADMTVVLFSNDPSVHTFANGFKPRVSVESNIDFNFLGTPFFHSMVSRIQVATSDISILIDPETVLLEDFITTLYHVNKLEAHWFLVSTSINISHFPFHLDEALNTWRSSTTALQTDLGKLREFLVQNHHPKCQGERVILAWNAAGSVPLLAGVIPSFLYGKGFHNQWLIHEVQSSGFRLVIDATDAISSFYLDELHDPSKHYQAPDGTDDVYVWEKNSNSHLASVYGSLSFQQNTTPQRNLLRLLSCFGQHIFIDTSGNLSSYLQYHDSQVSGDEIQIRESKNEAGFMKRFFHKSKSSKWSACVARGNSCSIMNLPKVVLDLPAPLVLPFSLEELLEMVADENKSVVLAVAGDSYRDMLMSWVCRLRHLSVKNFLVGALDAETYKFSVLQGLPVFVDRSAPSNISFNNCHFGSDCFPRVTKVKSRLVLQIMKLGYNVLLSDVDVYWFQNPLPILHSFGPAVLVAQSDEYNETEPINLPRRLNSGFYFGRSDETTISAIEKVVHHASVSDLSEQPSFYDVLCGVGGVNRVGDDRCLEPETNLTVHFLDRDLFPNGAFRGHWEKSDVGKSCRKRGCIMLHNNWISGRQRKLERQLRSGLWAFDSASRICLQSEVRIRRSSSR